MIPASAHSIRRISSRRLRLLHRLAFGCGLLLAVTLVAYAFVIGAFRGDAAEQLLCMRICAMGVNPCLPTTCANPPGVVTMPVTAITQSTATGNGNVTSDGGDSVSERGTVIATTTAPTISDSAFAAASGGTGVFTASITGLATSTLYYARSYATNDIATSYGTTTSFTTSASGGSGGGSQGGQGNGNASPSGGGGGAPITPVKPPKKKKPLKDLLIASHPIQDRPDVYLGTIGNFFDEQPTEQVHKDKKSKLKYNRPTFSGRTNIKDAQIFISLYSDVFYATAGVDEEGYWSWIVSEHLEEGEHTFVMLAVSPEDDEVAVSEAYTFIVAAQETAPAQPPIETPAEIPSEPGIGAGSSGPVELTPEPIEVGATHQYAIQVEVTSNPEEISQQGHIDLKTEVTSFVSDPSEPVQLTYTLYDHEGNIVFNENKSITVTDTATDYSRAVTSQPLTPGRYAVDVQLTYKGRTIATTKTFEVKSFKVIDTPLVAISYEDSRILLERSVAALGFMLGSILILMYREYQMTKRALRRINDHDLFSSGLVA